MGVQPFLISSSLIGVLAQRLVKKLCSECKEPFPLTQYEKEILDIKEVPSTAEPCRPVGCEHCKGTGYSGMTVVAELLTITDAIRQLILKKVDSTSIKRKGVEEGMVTLAMDAIDKIYNGTTSVQEVLRAIVSEAEEE